MYAKDRVIVLSVKAFRETGFIIKALCENRGLSSFLIQGARGKVKRKRHFEVFACYDFVFYNNSKSDLKRIKELDAVVLSKDYSPLRNFLASFCSEICLQCVQEEEQNPELFQLLYNQSVLLSEEPSDEELHLLFLRKLMDVLGVSPAGFATSEGYVFDLLNSELTSLARSQDSKNLLDNEETHLFSRFVNKQSPFGKNGDQRHLLILSIMRFFQIHVPGFKQPKSLEVLHTILHS